MHVRLRMSRDLLLTVLTLLPPSPDLLAKEVEKRENLLQVRLLNFFGEAAQYLGLHVRNKQCGLA